MICCGIGKVYVQNVKKLMYYRICCNSQYKTRNSYRILKKSNGGSYISFERKQSRQLQTCFEKNILEQFYCDKMHLGFNGLGFCRTHLNVLSRQQVKDFISEPKI